MLLTFWRNLPETLQHFSKISEKVHLFKNSSKLLNVKELVQPYSRRWLEDKVGSFVKPATDDARCEKKLYSTRITYTCFTVRTIFSLNIFSRENPSDFVILPLLAQNGSKCKTREICLLKCSQQCNKPLHNFLFLASFRIANTFHKLLTSRG